MLYLKALLCQIDPKLLGGGNSNTFLIFYPENWGKMNEPILTIISYFSNGLVVQKPPTRLVWKERGLNTEFGARGVHMDVSLKGGTPQIIHFNRVFHINHPFWGYPYFRKPLISFESFHHACTEFPRTFPGFYCGCKRNDVFFFPTGWRTQGDWMTIFPAR